MEKINNKRGSSTIEAVIIIPIILVFIMLIIMILILSYEKTAQVISVHKMFMTGTYKELSVLGNSEITVDGNKLYVEETYFSDKELKYEYSPNNIDVRDVQNITEVLFYLTDEYQDEIEEINSD